MKFNYPQAEWKLIFSCIVAGKNAKFAENATNALLMYPSHVTEGTVEIPQRLISPFETLRWYIDLGVLMNKLQGARTGNYRKLDLCFRTLVNRQLDIATCSVEDLERTHGIGPKTSRFFILWTRPGAQHAALDVHVLRWLRHQGHVAPRSTPTGGRYAALERIFIDYAASWGLTPRELDARIWDCGRLGGMYAHSST